jgi:hypothetical protein
MKLLIGSGVGVVFLLILFFGGMATGATAPLMLSSMGFCLVGNPLLWVAVYRVLAGAAGGRIVWQPTGTEPARKSVSKVQRIGGEL